MEKFQAVIYGVKQNANGQETITSALLPFSVIAKDVKGKELTKEDGTPKFISEVNFFSKMLTYQLAEIQEEELVKYDYLFRSISVSGRKYGRVTHFGYVDENNTLCPIGNFGTDENGQFKTAKDVFPQSATIVNKCKKANDKELNEMNAKEKREFCRKMAEDVVVRCNFTENVLVHWELLTKEDKEDKGTKK